MAWSWLHSNKCVCVFHDFNDILGIVKAGLWWFLFGQFKAYINTVNLSVNPSHEKFTAYGENLTAQGQMKC